MGKQQRQLAEIVANKGGGAIVAQMLSTKKLPCSQQAVSAWVRGKWLPRRPMQGRIKQVYGISVGWKLPKKVSTG